MPCTTLFDVQGGTKPRKAGFENLTGNIEFPWRDCISCPTASFFHEICTAASPASGKLLRSLFPWGMTTNWNVRRWNFMQEILKTCFPWFCPTLYDAKTCQFGIISYLRRLLLRHCECSFLPAREKVMRKFSHSSWGFWSCFIAWTTWEFEDLHSPFLFIASLSRFSALIWILHFTLLDLP